MKNSMLSTTSFAAIVSVISFMAIAAPTYAGAPDCVRNQTNAELRTGSDPSAGVNLRAADKLAHQRIINQERLDIAKVRENTSPEDQNAEIQKIRVASAKAQSEHRIADDMAMNSDAEFDTESGTTNDTTVVVGTGLDDCNDTNLMKKNGEGVPDTNTN